ncbi:ATP-binding protein [Uliginosibacterium sp. 31-16]|uniref:ATP-binding protein n=1 Tax=Uliginosibacterium sp. 31-16 TaxID=3068315 RepID=UPI00273E4CAD|nr:ATP-binding protein [Uliginosibacterium sp. 31-16]MDP5240174.1 ATP-binding protein [Uliginosibacterium sp. 31-16]
MLKSGLRSKIIFSAAVVIVVTTGMIALAATLFFVSQQVNTLQSRSSAVARGLTVQLERITNLGIAIEDIVGFDEQCSESVRSYPGMSYTQVVRTDGTILFDSRPQHAGHKLESPILMKAMQQGETAPARPIDGEYVVLEPVLNASSSRVASVIVAFPRSLVDDAVVHMLLLGGGVGACVGALGLLVLFAFLRHQVIKPISALVRTVTHVRDHPGDYSVRVPPQQDDEIGLLVDGFNQLLGKMEERERELIEARDTSDKANRMKSDFLAAMSHDLRTPMHAILSMNELLRGTSLTEKQQRYSLNVHKAGQWLLGIINDILAFAKIESGKLDLLNAEFDLRQLVEDIITLQEDFAHSKKLSLTWQVAEEIPERLIGDGPRLMQMLTNLISNAIKFTEQGSVHLDVMPAHQHITFSVTDTGIGIDPAKLSLLFEPFVQVASADAQRRSGTGLGLSIVKQLAEAMGGEVGVDSSLQHGATFWFTARLRPVEQNSPATEAA